MAALILQNRFTRQPQYAAGIDWGNPIARDLVFAAYPGSPELISGVMPSKIGNAAISAFDRGRSFQSTSTTTDGWYWNLPANHPLYSITTDDTLLVLAKRIAGSSYNNMFGVPYRSGTWASPYFAWAFSALDDNTIGTMSFAEGPGGRVTRNSNAGFFQNDSAQAYGFTRSVSSIRFYRGNKQFGTDAAGSGLSPDWTNKQPPILFNRSNSAAGEGMVAHGGLVLVFRRQLAPVEWASLAENPWQIFKAPARKLYAAGATAGGIDSAIAWLEENDVTAIAGAATVAAAATWAESDDATALDATLTATSTAAWTEVDDTAAIAANCTVSAAAAWTDVDDVAALLSVATVAASASWAEQSDIASVAASVGDVVSVSAAWVESGDVTSALSAIKVSADAGWSEESDLAGFSASVLSSAGLAWVEQDDAAYVAVGVSLAPSAALYWAEESDLCAITGISDGVAPIDRQYPLAGVEQDYPITQARTYPLAGMKQTYPLGN